MKKTGKKMEIEDLALLMHKGFDGIHGKFENIESRMATKTEIEDLAIMVGRGFEEIHGKFKDIDDKFDEFRKKLRADLRDTETRLTYKIEAMDMRIGSYILESENRVGDLHERVSELDGRVNKIEDKLVGVK